MRVLLVYPMPSQESPQQTPPLSILYVGAYLERRGYEVEYFDERSDCDLALKIDWADVVGVSSMSGYQLGRALSILKQAKDAGKITVIGGVHPSLAPDTCKEVDYIDFIVRGDGEAAMEIILWAIEHGQRQTLPQDGIIVGMPLKGEEIESPITDKTLPYFHIASETDDVMLPASRGCAFNCGFCYNGAKPDSGKWRPIPINTWQTDLTRLLSNGIRIRFLQIGDDWLGNAGRIHQIGTILSEKGIKWHLSARSNQITEALACRLKDLNCTGVSIGAESGSDAILKLINKKITVADTLKAARILAQFDIKPLYYLIIGFPTESRYHMASTFDLADELHQIHKGNCSIAVFGYDALIGTPLYKLSESLGESVPKTLSECASRERSNTPDAWINAVYYIAGLRFHRTRGDKTDKNFPGWRRVLILPFELLCMLRWRLRYFDHFETERRLIKRLLTYAGSTRR